MRKNTAIAVFLVVGLSLIAVPCAIAGSTASDSSGVFQRLTSWLNKEPGYKVGFGPVQDWKLTPGFSYFTKYDSNIYRAPNGHRTDDVIMTYTPSLELSRQTDSFQMKSKYSMEFENYLKHSDQNAFNHRVDNNLSFTKGRFTFKAEDNFGDVKAYASSEQSERTRFVYNNLNSEVLARLTEKYSVSGIYRNNLLSYNGSALREFSTMQHEFGGRTYLHATPKFDLYLQGLGDFIQYYRDGPYNSRGVSLDVGAKGVLASKLVASVETGFRGRDYHNDSVKDYYNWRLQGTLKYLLTPKMSVGLIGLRDVQPSIYESVGWYEVNMFGVNFDYQLTEKMKITAGTSYANNHYPSQTQRNTDDWKKRSDDLVVVSTAFQWDLFKTVSYRLGYTYQTRQSNFNSFDYNDHIIETGIDARF